MSLKAKIEAVIYASEEPVTLAQLVGLLGHEAQAELDHISAAQQSLDLDETPADPETLNREVLDEEETPEEETAELPPESEAAPAEPEAELETETAPDEITPAAEQETDAPVEAVPDEKAAARQNKEKERKLRDYFRSILDQLINDYAMGDRGLEIREVASGYRMATKPEYHDAVRGFVKSLKPPLKLSLQALETLAVVAYKQPVTAPEISEIRGVDSGGVLGSLMARKLVTTAGRKQVIGRPILYKTTRDFLLRFGLKDVNELPSIEEFEKMAGELAEQEEIPMTSEDHDSETGRRNEGIEAPESITHANLEEERDAVEPQADGDSSSFDTVPVDGRISGPPPAYNETDDAIDSPAMDAKIQSDQQKDSTDSEDSDVQE